MAHGEGIFLKVPPFLYSMGEAHQDILACEKKKKIRPFLTSDQQISSSAAEAQLPQYNL